MSVLMKGEVISRIWATCSGCPWVGKYRRTTEDALKDLDAHKCPYEEVRE